MSSSEKSPIEHTRVSRRLVTVLTFACVVILTVFLHLKPSFDFPNFDNTCVAPEKIPLNEDKTNYLLYDPGFRKNSSMRLSKAVQVDTTVNDDQKDFSKIQKFHDYLESEFPAVFAKADVDIVNGYGYVIQLTGSDVSLKPILLMAHQDTVPIGDRNLWHKNPWSGEIDDDYVYGRGAADDKTLLIGLMESADLIVKEGFQNKRTIIFAFGFDEEIGGYHGAQEISKFLLNKYGPKAMELVVDEGAGCYLDVLGAQMLAIPVAEKGDLDVDIYATGISGHSSMPPEHTAIGILSRFLTDYERKEYPIHLSDDNPMLPCMECIAKNSTVLSRKEKLLISRAAKDSRAAALAARIYEDTPFKYTVRTTRAIDIIDGGNKINALPISAHAGVNHRIVFGESIASVLDKLTEIGKNVATDFNIGLTVNGTEIFEATPKGSLNVTIGDLSFNPSFVSSHTDDIWQTYTGYLRSLYEDFVHKDELKGKVLGAAPVSFFGNTDTRWMWDVSDHIYRVTMGPMTMKGFHAPDEAGPIDSHLQLIAFYYNYLKGTC